MQKPPLITFNVVLFTVLTLITVIGVPTWAYLYGFSGVEIGVTVFLFFFTGMSITAGYHRLWSHKAYQAHPIVRFVLAIGGAMTLQNSILHWASDHRVHHKHVDVNDKDPYSAKRGFWFSHIGWMLREYQAERYDDYSNCRDLQKDKIVMWQHNYYVPIVLIANFGLTALLGYLNGSVLGMMLLAGVARIVMVHHVTFFINSLCHIWGKQTYTNVNTARDNGILALFTFGEGYHNFHHIFEYDYRNGIRWFHYDPTKWLIKSLALLGLAKNLRKCPEDRIQQARFSMQLLKAQHKIAKYPNAELLKAKLEAEYEELLSKCNAYYETKKRLVRIQQRQLQKSVEKSVEKLNHEKAMLQEKCNELHHAFMTQKEQWKILHRTALVPN
ncbi:MAG: fatty acid desaturase [Glaciecola sp.]|jgi:stearoyl-CoA desaturase (delta-9 desaturase)